MSALEYDRMQCVARLLAAASTTPALGAKLAYMAEARTVCEAVKVDLAMYERGLLAMELELKRVEREAGHG